GQEFHVASFLMSDSANVTIAVNSKAEKVTIRPLRHDLVDRTSTTYPDEESSVLSFALEKPLKLIVEIDGLPSLVLNASPPEADAPDPDDPSVLYFGP